METDRYELLAIEIARRIRQNEALNIGEVAALLRERIPEQKWVSVKEGLPARRYCVFGYCPDNDCIYTVFLDDDGLFKYFDNGSPSRQTQFEVTAWIGTDALPAAPKEG